jgi:serine/threonine protein kinase
MYDFERELGNGAFSVVKMAKHKETGDVVAIKVRIDSFYIFVPCFFLDSHLFKQVLEKYEDDPRQATKFRQEIEIMKQLNHNNIIKFYELDEDKDSYYVVMEVVDGGELFDQIVSKKYYYESEAAPIIAQVLKPFLTLMTSLRFCVQFLICTMCLVLSTGT